MENAQRRATKLAPALRDLYYVDRINALDLLSLYYRRARGDMIETYKPMSGIYAVDAEYIKPDKSLTWGHSFKLKKERSMKNTRQQYYSNSILNSWNMLPAEVVSTPSLNAFKTDWIVTGGGIDIAHTRYMMRII